MAGEVMKRKVSRKERTMICEEVGEGSVSRRIRELVVAEGI